MGNQFDTKSKRASMVKDDWSHLRFWSIFMIAALSIHFIDLLGVKPALALPLSPGDRIRLLIPEGELFSGVYEVNIDGNIQIPYLDPLAVKGLEISEVKQKIYHTLIDRKFFQPTFLQVNVSILQWAAIQVSVSGATFQAGRVSINNRSAEDRSLQQNQSSGDNPPERYLTAALRGAGGITPMANVKEIRVIRDGLEQIVDLSGIFTGEEVEDVALIAGDRVIVPELPQQQNSLVRPSQITPPGIRVFLSNLTTPATSNASSSIKSDGSAFPYGARLSQAVIAANCVGGTSPTNAPRRAVLVRTDRQTGATKVFDRDVEEIIRNSTDDTNNPFLMPEDGVGCYDSTVTDVRDVVRTITDILLTPFNLIFRGGK
ncbi:polysaccharide biosynthesis/export family protein [Pseudanabaena sp. ABRG5-3]|uniref:polysaccharide biosynthesis/export family protein n=1 Tax=Pseudanabaena sp. ABRG5-3 TaxID=685565 RepID=UPI001CECAC61|nr:polysaccharide biosynthesis/export family protein [Pseudanabaena sp. ABRG5-3]